MVCLNESHHADGLVTDFIRQSERIATAQGSLCALDWLKREQSRLAKSGIATEIVEIPSQRIALYRPTVSC